MKFQQNMRRWYPSMSVFAWLRARPILVVICMAAACWLVVGAVLMGVVPSGT